MTHRTAWMGLALVVVLGVAAEARAEVTVLGLRSLEGDEALAERLTGYIRDFVARRGLDRVSDKTQTLEQMTLLADCGDDVDPRCMREIAEMLGADDIVYGFISRMPGEGGRFTYAIDLRRFSAGSRRDVRSASGSLESSRQGTANLQILANTLIDGLWEQRAATTLIVQSNESGAAVYVDGDLVGRTGAEPLWVTDVSPGEHEVRVVKEGLDPWERVVDVARNQYRLLEAPLGGGTVAVGPDVGPGPGPGPGLGFGPGPGPEPGGGESSGVLGDWRLWTGAGLLAAGVGMAGVGIYYGVETLWNMPDRDPVYSYRLEVGPSVSDVCEYAATDTNPDHLHAEATRNECDKADTYQIVQWVMWGLAAAAGGVGTYFLIDLALDDNGAESPDTALQLTPTAFFGGGGLTLQGTF